MLCRMARQITRASQWPAMQQLRSSLTSTLTTLWEWNGWVQKIRFLPWETHCQNDPQGTDVALRLADTAYNRWDCSIFCLEFSLWIANNACAFAGSHDFSGRCCGEWTQQAQVPGCALDQAISICLHQPKGLRDCTAPLQREWLLVRHHKGTFISHENDSKPLWAVSIITAVQK